MHNPDPTHFEDVCTYKIGEEEVGQRLDRYLVTMLGDISRTTVQQMINDGVVLVNGRNSKPGYALRTSDEVRVLQVIAKPYTATARPQPLPLDIV